MGCNPSTTEKVFCGFYKVRRNKDNWIKPYFEIFKDAYKNKKHLNTIKGVIIVMPNVDGICPAAIIMQI